MARPIWRGAISFGLVTVPVRLYTAVRSKDVRFRQIHKETKAPVKQKRVDAETGEEVLYDDIAKGYELAEGTYVVVDKEELSALDPESSRSIEILDYVDQGDIDPLYYDRPYFLGPDYEHGTKPYRLLTDAMEGAGKVAIARFVMRDKEHLAAIRAHKGRLVLSTMHFADELVDPAELGIDDALQDVTANDREVAMAEQLIESMASDFEPESYRDEYRERLMEFLEAKAQGEQVEIRDDTEEGDGEVIDLMTALERSLERRGDAKQTPGHAADADGSDGEVDENTKNAGPTGDYAEMTRSALYELAQKRDLPGRSDMTKDELVEALQQSDASTGAA